MQRSKKPSGHCGIRRTLVLIAVLAATAGALSCVPKLGCSNDPVELRMVEPSDARMAPGESKQFALMLYYQGKSQKGLNTPADAWSATGGSISPSGEFVAPEKSGTYVVKATKDGEDYTSQVTVVAATVQPKEPSSDGGVAKARGEKERIFENGSDAGGHPGAKIPEFTIDRPRVIVEIMTYHWDYNDHKLGTIALKNVETGKTYGPWETVGGTGQGGVENAYWLAHPNVEIPSGTYELVDSSPSTWFTNSEMKGYGGAYVDALK